MVDLQASPDRVFPAGDVPEPVHVGRREARAPRLRGVLRLELHRGARRLQDPGE